MLLIYILAGACEAMHEWNYRYSNHKYFITIIIFVICIAYPELLNGVTTLSIQAIERINATLPCHMSVSRLNSLTVTWHRNMNGPTTLVTNGVISSEDYSLTLFNVTNRDAGLYFCRAINNNLSDGNFKILAGPQVQLSITQEHSE